MDHLIHDTVKALQNNWVSTTLSRVTAVEPAFSIHTGAYILLHQLYSQLCYLYSEHMVLSISPLHNSII